VFFHTASFYVSFCAQRGSSDIQQQVMSVEASKPFNSPGQGLS